MVKCSICGEKNFFIKLPAIPAVGEKIIIDYRPYRIRKRTWKIHLTSEGYPIEENTEVILEI